MSVDEVDSAFFNGVCFVFFRVLCSLTVQEVVAEKKELGMMMELVHDGKPLHTWTGMGPVCRPVCSMCALVDQCSF